MPCTLERNPKSAQSAAASPRSCMILVDTSTWADHFRYRDQPLVELLKNGRVSMHLFVRGKLALGNLEPRAEILQLLSELPQSTIAADEELLHIVKNRCGLASA